MGEKMTLEQEVKVLRVKCAGSLANNLCPDHRDKQVGKPCLACTIEKLEGKLAHLTQPAQAVDAVSTELRTMRGEFAKQFKRAERAEALLREAESELRGACLSRESARISQNIRAHLSENSR